LPRAVFASVTDAFQSVEVALGAPAPAAVLASAGAAETCKAATPRVSPATPPTILRATVRLVSVPVLVSMCFMAVLLRICASQVATLVFPVARGGAPALGSG
jgi:hypothetical protein